MDKTKEFAYQKLIDVGDYRAEYQSDLELVNISKLINDVSNNQKFAIKKDYAGRVEYAFNDTFLQSAIRGAKNAGIEPLYLDEVDQVWGIAEIAVAIVMKRSRVNRGKDTYSG